MNDKQIRIYSVCITIAAAILLIAVVTVSVMLKNERSRTAQPESESVVQNLPEAEPDPEGGSVWESESYVEGTTDPAGSMESIFNVGGIVGWEAGNNDLQNIINGWKNMLSQLDIDADIAFIGDSITHRGDFRPYFKGNIVVNLGCGGDTIRGVYNRAELLQYVHAEKIVVMCGVNVLRSDNVDYCRTEYSGLLNAIREYSPDSQVYVCSILPMRKDWQEAYCYRDTTIHFNEMIKEMADAKGMTYVDLYSLFEYYGEIKAEYTVDGIHLSKDGYDLWMSALYPYMFSE